MTEDLPAIKTYEEALSAETADGRDASPEPSLRLLAAMHRRWTILLRGRTACSSRTALGAASASMATSGPTWCGERRSYGPGCASPTSRGSPGQLGVRHEGLERAGKTVWNICRATKPIFDARRMCSLDAISRRRFRECLPTMHYVKD